MDKRMTILISVIEAGSFNKAGEVSLLSHQAIIKHINALEAELGTKLLIRSSRGIMTTPSGEVLYQGLKKIESFEKDLFEQVRNTPCNRHIHIAAIEHHVLLSPICNAYQKLHPEIEIVSNIFSTSNELSLLRNGLIDVGEMPATNKPLPEGIVYEKMCDAPYLCAMDPADPLANHTELTLKDLHGREITLSEHTKNALYSTQIIRCLSANAHIRQTAPPHLRKSDVLYDACADHRIYISPSPFLAYLPEVRVIPLRVPYTKEYGIIFRKGSPPHIIDLVQVAKTFYMHSSLYLPHFSNLNIKGAI